MDHVKTLYKYAVLILALLLLIVSCAPKSSYNVRSFLFDGVPNPFEIVPEVVIDTVALTPQDSILALTPIPKEPVFQVHPPYLEKKCKECHDYAGMSLTKFTAPINDLCFKCHTDFNNVYTNVHGPVASGNCTQCHSPHKSKIKHILREEGKELCFKCHDEHKIINYKIHETIEEKNCVTCHNPHGGTNNYYLQTNACYECHDNFEEKYKYMHGPVGAGSLCASCHENHSSTKPRLLKIVGNALCLNCHNKSDIDENQAHVSTTNKNCTSCHNPHGSPQPMLLTKTGTE